MTAPEFRPRWIGSAVCIFLVAITWIVFGQILRHDFVNYDDADYVYQNAKVKSGLSAAGIRWAFTHVHAQNWHPLTTMSHMLDCQFHELNPGAHHFGNVLLHSLAMLLLFLVLWRMTGALWRSAFVAGLLAVHPLHVESVAWVSERKDVLSGVFFMATLAGYVRYARSPSIFRFFVVALLLALGLMSKPMLVTLPVVLLLLDYWPLGRFSRRERGSSKAAIPNWWNEQPVARRLVLEKMPLLLLAAASGVVTFLAQRDALGGTEQLPVGLRVNNAIVSYVVYIWQMLWPVNLAVFYPHPERHLPTWEVGAALAVLIGATAAAFASRKQKPYLLTGWLWYLIMLLPVIGVVQVGWQARADRYTYLPQIGLYLMVTWGIADWLRSWAWQRQVLGGAAAVVLALLTWRARSQASFWKNSETLWRHALAVTSDNDVAENNLGIVLLGRGETDEAISRFERAVQLRPENAPAHDNLAKAFLRKGQVEEAMTQSKRLLELQPENSEARNNLGTVLVQQGRVKEAMEQWLQTLVIDPENGNAKSNLAWVLATCPDGSYRDGPKAVQLAGEALQLSGGKNPLIRRTLAAAYAEAGRFSEAIETAGAAEKEAHDLGNAGLVDELARNLAQYREGQPLRDPSLTTGHASP